MNWKITGLFACAIIDRVVNWIQMSAPGLVPAALLLLEARHYENLRGRDWGFLLKEGGGMKLTEKQQAWIDSHLAGYGSWREQSSGLD